MPFKTRDAQVLTLGDDWREIVLLESLHYQDAVRCDYLVPKGLRSDYGSVPRLFWSWIPPHQYRAEYLLHDALYMGEVVSRAEADKILRHALAEAGCNLIRRNIIYTAVRIGGYFVWRKHKPDETAKIRQLILDQGGQPYWSYAQAT